MAKESEKITLNTSVEQFIEAANKSHKEGMEQAAQGILTAIGRGENPSRYSNLYDAFSQASPELSAALEKKHGFIHKDMLNDGDKGNPDYKEIFIKDPRSAQDTWVVSWAGKVQKEGVPQEMRQEVLSIAKAVNEGTETRTPEELTSHMSKRYQQIMDDVYPKLESGEMKSLNIENDKTSLMYVSNSANNCLKSDPKDSRFQAFQKGTTEYLKGIGVSEDDAKQFVSELTQKNPTLLFTLSAEVQGAITNGEAHIVNAKAAKLSAIAPEYLTNMQQRNEHAVDASSWIREATKELASGGTSVNQWFKDHESTLKNHETTILQDIQKDIKQVPGVFKQEESLGRIATKLEKLGVDQTEERKELETLKSTKSEQTKETTANKVEEPAKETKSLWSRFKSGVKNVVNEVKNAITDAVNNITEAVSNAWKNTFTPEEKGHEAVIGGPTNVQRVQGIDTGATKEIKTLVDQARGREAREVTGARVDDMVKGAQTLTDNLVGSGLLPKNHAQQFTTETLARAENPNVGSPEDRALAQKALDSQSKAVKVLGIQEKDGQLPEGKDQRDTSPLGKLAREAGERAKAMGGDAREAARKFRRQVTQLMESSSTTGIKEGEKDTPAPSHVVQQTQQQTGQQTGRGGRS